LHSLDYNGKALLGRESKKAVHFVADFFNITQTKNKFTFSGTIEESHAVSIFPLEAKFKEVFEQRKLFKQ